jgi:uncharacterized membrane protein
MANVTRDQRWVGRNSFYVEHGDWFVAVCACLAAHGRGAAGDRDLCRERAEGGA